MTCKQCHSLCTTCPSLQKHGARRERSSTSAPTRSKTNARQAAAHTQHDDSLICMLLDYVTGQQQSDIAMSSVNLWGEICVTTHNKDVGETVERALSGTFRDALTCGHPRLSPQGSMPRPGTTASCVLTLLPLSFSPRSRTRQALGDFDTTFGIIKIVWHRLK